MNETTVDQRLRAGLQTWMKGIGPEVGFWSNWLRTKGMRWPEDYQRRMDPSPSFEIETGASSAAERVGAAARRIRRIGSSTVTAT